MRSLSRLIVILVAVLTACGQAPAQILPTQVTLPTESPATPTSVSNAAITQPTDATPAPPLPPGTIRFVHAALDTPNINLVTGVQAIATNLEYAESTESISLDGGDYTVNVVQSGSRPNDPPLFEGTFSVEGGESQVVIITKQDGQLALITLPETIDPLNAGESIITVVNTVSGTPNVQLSQDTTSLTQAIPFGQTETTGILPSGETTLRIQAGDAAQPYDITLDEGRHYTLVLAGSPGNITVASFSTPSPGRAAVRAINASSELGLVDVYLDDQPIAENVEFGRPTTRQNVISGDYTVNVYEAGSDQANAEPLFSEVITVQPGENTAFILLGSADDLVMLPYVEDLSPTPPDRARIVFLNTLESVPRLHLETSGGPLPDVPDTAYGDQPPQTLLSADRHSFFLARVGRSDENLTVENVENVELEPGTYYLYLVTGRQDNQPVILSEDVGIDESLAPDINLQQNDLDTAEPAQVRFINAIGNQMAADFKINDVLAANVGYGQGSEFVPIPPSDETTISITSPGDTLALQVAQDPLASGEHYTVLAYGTDESDIRLLVLPDTDLIFDGRSPYLRLINLSATNDSSIGLGFSPQDPAPPPGTTVEPNEDLRRSIPGGIHRLVENILGGTVSPIILMPTGIFDMEILDTATNQLATTLLNQSLESGQHYDVITYEEPDTTRIQAFVVQYPLDSE